MKVKHWLEILPPEIKEQAIKNSNIPEWMDEDVSSLKEALQGAFLWSNSPEKWNYWNRVATKYN